VHSATRGVAETSLAIDLILPINRLVNRYSIKIIENKSFPEITTYFESVKDFGLTPRARRATPLAVAFVALLVEEFVARYRRGERPALAEYVADDLELAEQIQEFLPALVMMEQIKPADANLDPQLLST
jgi:hypothetical protein